MTCSNCREPSPSSASPWHLNCAGVVMTLCVFCAARSRGFESVTFNQNCKLDGLKRTPWIRHLQDFTLAFVERRTALPFLVVRNVSSWHFRQATLKGMLVSLPVGS